MKRIMLIGYGAMAREVAARLPQGVRIAWIVVPATLQSALVTELDGTGIAALDDVRKADGIPDLVLECAGHEALAVHGVATLEQGWPLAVVSIGALADETLHARLVQAARAGRARLQLLSGAVAGMDGLAAAREAGLDEVIYISRKSPQSWRRIACGEPD
jgi:aspartate dehydrogenase